MYHKLIGLARHLPPPEPDEYLQRIYADRSYYATLRKAVAHDLSMLSECAENMETSANALNLILDYLEHQQADLEDRIRILDRKLNERGYFA